LLFLLALGGGLLLWTQGRKPREMRVEVDLTSALPGDIVEIDVVVRRAQAALARHDVRYGASGAPGMVQFTVHASPGEAEIETTLLYARGPAHRAVAPVKLSEDSPARVQPR
jgi:hypothetical protein